MFIVPGTASKTVAEDLAKHLHQPVAKTTVKRFADHELYVRIEDDLQNQEVIIIQTTYPDPNILELFLLQDAVWEAQAQTITVVAPYFGYGRQDKKFQDGEAISARALAEHISIHADRFITVDPHKDHILKFFPIPAMSCSAAPAIADFLKKKKKKIDFILAPDKNALTRAQHIADQLGCSYDYIEKTRIDSQTVHIQPKTFHVENKNVVIIDDIISTGGTMIQSAKELKKQGANEISVACTHGLFIGDAQQKLHDVGCHDIIATDTIQSEYGKVKTAPCIADLIQRNGK